MDHSCLFLQEQCQPYLTCLQSAHVQTGQLKPPLACDFSSGIQAFSQFLTTRWNLVPHISSKVPLPQVKTASNLGKEHVFVTPIYSCKSLQYIFCCGTWSPTDHVKLNLSLQFLMKFIHNMVQTLEALHWFNKLGRGRVTCLGTCRKYMQRLPIKEKGKSLVTIPEAKVLRCIYIYYHVYIILCTIMSWHSLLASHTKNTHIKNSCLSFLEHSSFPGCIH